eukprot:5116895-Pyramimonas_sp.AAC.1
MVCLFTLGHSHDLQLLGVLRREHRQLGDLVVNLGDQRLVVPQGHGRAVRRAYGVVCLQQTNPNPPLEDANPRPGSANPALETLNPRRYADGCGKDRPPEEDQSEGLTEGVMTVNHCNYVRNLHASFGRAWHLAPGAAVHHLGLRQPRIGNLDDLVALLLGEHVVPDARHLCKTIKPELGPELEGAVPTLVGFRLRLRYD